MLLCSDIRLSCQRRLMNHDPNRISGHKSGSSSKHPTLSKEAPPVMCSRHGQCIDLVDLDILYSLGVGLVSSWGSWTDMETDYK